MKKRDYGIENGSGDASTLNVGSGLSSDFTQLQREYRNMELNRKAYADESNQLLRRQQVEIDKLKKNNETLKSEIHLETKHHIKTTTGGKQISKLQEQVDHYVQKLDTEQKQLTLVQQQIGMMRHKVLHQKKNMGGVHAPKENQHMINKQIRILENRLDKALIKFNESLACNKTLRETIDNLRRERVIYDNIYKKIEKELHDKKKQMANIIELSNNAYEHRDRAQMEALSIEQMNRNEQENFERQMKEINLMIEESKITIAHTRNCTPEEKIRGDMNVEEEQKLKKKVHKGAWGVAKDKVNVQVSIERVQNFEDAFNKIKAATGISDIEQLVTNFITNEDQNFSLFNYVNEQANEIEKLEDQIQQLKEEERKYAQDNGDDVNQHKQLLQDLEQRLESTDATAEKYEIKCAEAQKTINALKVGISSIFNKIECNVSSMSEILGDGTVTEANMMQYLGIIEQRTNDILHSYNTYQQLRQTEQDYEERVMSNHQNLVALGPPTAMGHEQLQINPPNLEDYSTEGESQDEEEDTRPLSREEMKLKTLKGIQKGHQNQEAKQRRLKLKKQNGLV